MDVNCIVILEINERVCFENNLSCSVQQTIVDRKQRRKEDKDCCILYDSKNKLSIVDFLVIDDFLYLVFNNDKIHLENFALPSEFASLKEKYSD